MNSNNVKSTLARAVSQLGGAELLVLPEIPDAPRNCAVYHKPGSTTIQLSWANPKPENCAYFVLRSVAGRPFELLTVTVQLQCTDRTIRPKTNYTYQVRATNISGTSAGTHCRNIMTAPEPGLGQNIVRSVNNRR